MHFGEWYRRGPFAQLQRKHGAAGTSGRTQGWVHLDERSWRVGARDCGGQAEGHDRPRGGNGRPRDISSIVRRKKMVHVDGFV